MNKFAKRFAIGLLVLVSTLALLAWVGMMVLSRTLADNIDFCECPKLAAMAGDQDWLGTDTSPQVVHGSSAESEAGFDPEGEIEAPFDYRYVTVTLPGDPERGLDYTRARLRDLGLRPVEFEQDPSSSLHVLSNSEVYALPDSIDEWLVGLEVVDNREHGGMYLFHIRVFLDAPDDEAEARLSALDRGFEDLPALRLKWSWLIVAAAIGIVAVFWWARRPRASEAPSG